MSAPRFDRRQVLGLGVSAVTAVTAVTAVSGAVGLAGLLAPRPLRAALPEHARGVLAQYYGDASMAPGRVEVTLPPLSENGSSVSCAVAVDSPMTATDHVAEVRLFAGRNPLPEVARATFTPACGVARMETRIRLADSQTVVAVARMADGTLYYGGAEVIVTLAACIDLG